MSTDNAAMEQRISCLVICVDDVGVVRAFYEAMGWKVSSVSRESLPLFNVNGFVFMLSARKPAAEEAFGHPLPPEVAIAVDNPPAFNGVVLSYVVRNEEELRTVLDEAVLHGGRLLSPPAELPWGNLAGFFADPGGTVWEVSLTRRTPLQANGNFKIGE
ncbi:VOC family protein [Sphingomonadales bacterium 56]|uniref:VOC family protein n=1 Tax=unclassified Sphingobium TaxID=2611147 RepID=UPI00191A6D19|nr:MULTISPECIES: VOC family protein [unclassified Sphingobium]MBY2929209.1 VOC family protein [Sphingomonadales bacterium 56]MBY2958879.1 VOC family protein [Sphingomonadales bacterium 58]CAD7337966.1 hypothetical protein SPHS8_01821 [Sphingobium sp. S8]CAD7338996.1 hypothetical protein SPHS6_02232 [Sphingobium sp. S6]